MTKNHNMSNNSIVTAASPVTTNVADPRQVELTATGLQTPKIIPTEASMDPELRPMLCGEAKAPQLHDGNTALRKATTAVPKRVQKDCGAADKFHSATNIFRGSMSNLVSNRNDSLVSQSVTNINLIPKAVPSRIGQILKQHSVLAVMSSDHMARSYSSICDLYPQKCASATTTHVDTVHVQAPQLPLDEIKDETGAPDVSSATARFKMALRVCSSIKFVIYCFSLFTTSLGQSVVYVHLPAFVISLGATLSDASGLVAIMGFANIVSRFASGLVTNCGLCSNLFLFVSSLAMNGLLLYATPVIALTYLGQVAFAASFSFFGNAYCAIMTPLAIEIVGLTGLSTASGILLLGNGIGFLLGPPIAGKTLNYQALHFLFDLTISFVYKIQYFFV